MSSPAATTMTGHRGLWRWFVALVATVLLVVSGSGLVVFAQSGAGESKGPQFVPADAPVYIEARLDMPDGQAEALADFLTAFPGFADTGSFSMKTDQILNSLMEEATNGAVSFSGEVEKFVTGEIGLAVTDLEPALNGGDPMVLVGVAISDRAAAESFVDLLTAAASTNAESSEEMYGDTAIISGPSSSVAVLDEWILLSQDADQVKAGIDVLEGTTPSLADDPAFSTAFARVPSSRLGAVYMDLQSFGGLLDTAGMLATGQAGVDLPTEQLLAQLPENMVMYLAAASDRMSVEAFITPGPGTTSPPVGDSDLASLFPAGTQLYVETRELGTTLENALTGLFETMDEETAQQIAPIESMLGEPLPSFLDFVSDVGIGAALNSDGLWLGIAAEVNDDTAAAARVERLLSIVRLMAGSGSDSGIDITETTIGDAGVTVITLPVGDISAEAGVPISVGDTISIAVSDGSLLIGTGDFVETALTQSSVESLGASAGYTDALGGDSPNAGVLYVDIGSLLSTLDPMISAMIPQWADIQPYASGVDRFIAVGNADDEVISGRMTVIVNQ